MMVNGILSIHLLWHGSWTLCTHEFPNNIYYLTAETNKKSGIQPNVFALAKKMSRSEIRNKIHGTKQGELTTTDYYSELSELWQEIDYYEDLQAKSSEYAVLIEEFVE